MSRYQTGADVDDVVDVVAAAVVSDEPGKVEHLVHFLRIDFDPLALAAALGVVGGVGGVPLPLSAAQRKVPAIQQEFHEIWRPIRLRTILLIKINTSIINIILLIDLYNIIDLLNIIYQYY